jgi:hypothetical protein
MSIQTTLRRQLVVAVLASSMLTLLMSSHASWRRLPDELINRPDGTLSCAPGEGLCHPA